MANSNTKRCKKGGNEVVCERIEPLLTISNDNASNNSTNSSVPVAKSVHGSGYNLRRNPNCTFGSLHETIE